MGLLSAWVVGVGVAEAGVDTGGGAGAPEPGGADTAASFGGGLWVVSENAADAPSKAETRTARTSELRM